MDTRAIQDAYPDDLAHCFGCGRRNAQGHQIKSYWDGKEAVAQFTPQPHHIAIPGYVYGGLLASLIDCHATAIAAAALADVQGHASPVRCVTASLKVDYLRPTPLGMCLELFGRPKEIKGRKVVVEVRLLAGGEECAHGEVIAVQMPDRMIPNLEKPA
jgi:acyl-coenzyme A thioesterase PaaI-like protein